MGLYMRLATPIKFVYRSIVCFGILDSPSDSIKDRIIINKAILMILKVPICDLMKKLHEMQEIIIAIEPPFCGQ